MLHERVVRVISGIARPAEPDVMFVLRIPDIGLILVGILVGGWTIRLKQVLSQACLVVEVCRLRSSTDISVGWIGDGTTK